ncbi:AP-3 complex subunit delta, partial [Thraustotheca clavata]
MEEPDVGVVSCSVNVICELANKKPKNYVGLAPQFFRLLTTSSNNWMLIKVVKLMSSLVPEEPRLARKLLDPLATIIQNTPAKSLLYECISTVTTALLYTAKSDGSQPRNVPAIVKLCNDHLRRYIEDPDQNLRYLGLVGLSNLMQSHPHVISEHQQLILECLSVEDTTIRLRSLELLVGMVNPDNAPAIIEELMRHTLGSDGIYRQELIVKILHVCSINKYNNVQDFEWYIRILCQLSKLPGKDTNSVHGVEITRQLMDIAVRVKGIRSVLVKYMITLLLDKSALQDAGAATTAQVLYAAGWIIGEYILEYVENDDEDEDDEEDDGEEERLEKMVDVVDVMLQPSTTSLPASVQAVYMHNLLKLLTAGAEKADESTVDLIAKMILERLPAFVQSEHIEVQERACTLEHVVLGLGLGLDALSPEERANRVFDGEMISTMDGRLSVLNGYFSDPLAPVGAKAQRKVPLPPGLDLDSPFQKDEAAFLTSGGDLDNGGDDEVSFVQITKEQDSGYMNLGASESSADETSEVDDKVALEKQYELEKERLRHDPFYIKPSNAPNQSDNAFGNLLNALDKKSKKGKKGKGKKQRAIVMDDIMPDGGESSDEADDRITSYNVSNFWIKTRGGNKNYPDDTNLPFCAAMFEKTLADLVKGIRACKGDVSVYISQCMQEIKNELKANDPFVKAQAIRKLTYLNMQGYDMGWAAFHVVEVMSYERFAHKRIGYLAAGQSFTQATDVVLLCTNLFKKEFGSVNEFEVGLALNAMANICTTDLARDLLGDILALMNSHKPYVRKKATLILYKLFLRYPQGLRLS